MKLNPHLIGAALAAFITGPALAAVSIPGTTTYSQDFNGMFVPAAAGNVVATPPWTDNSTIPNWWFYYAANAVNAGVFGGANHPYNGCSGSVAPSLTLVSQGAASDSDRAFAAPSTTARGEQSGIVVFQNNHATLPVDLKRIRYNGEILRTNSAANTESIHVWYRTAASEAAALTMTTGPTNATVFPPAISSGPNAYYITGWTSVGAARWTYVSAAPFGPVNLTFPIDANGLNGIRVNPGEFLALRFSNINDGGTDALMGIDDLILDFTEVNVSVSAAVSGTTRAPGVSATDPTDDQMNFTLTVDGTGSVGPGWAITTGPLTGTTGNYGTPVNLSVAIAEFATPPHTLSILVEDQATPSATSSVSVTAPWTTITGSVANFFYDDSTTPNDASDDLVFYEASATGTYTGSNYTVTDAAGPQSTPYGTPASLAIDATVAPIGTPFTLTFSDDAYPTVTSSLIVNPPAIIGVNNASGSPVNILSLPATGDRRWTFNGTTRVSTQNTATQVDHVVDSEIIDLSTLPAVQVTATLDAIGGASSGFEAPDRFLMQLIIDGGTPVSMLGASDANGNGRLDGAGELPLAANTTTTFSFTGVVPASANSVQIRFVGNSNSPNETFVVRDILINTAAPTLATSVGTVTLVNQGTVDPADDMLRAPVTITPINLGASTGWTSGLVAPEGPANGLYSSANPVDFDVVPATAPRTVTLTDNLSALTSNFTVNAPAQTLAATLVAGSIVRNPDSTVSFQVNITPGNIGPAFSATVPALILEEPNPTTVTGSGPYTPGTPVTLTLVNPPSSGNVVVNIADVSYPTTPAPVNVTVAVPATTTYVVGKKDFGAGLQNVLSGAVTAPQWVNYPALPTMVMTAGGATDSIVETEELDVTLIDTVAFSAKFRAREVSTGTNFETIDRFKAELVYSIGGVPQTPVNLVAALDTGAGLPSTTGTGEAGAPDGYMSGYQGAAGTQVLPPNTVYANAAADYNDNADRDEFNPTQQPVADKISNIFTLSGSVPAAADSVKLVIYGAGVAGSEGFYLTDVLFSLGAADADGDGMDDAYELANGLNPNDPGDKFLDLDNDGQNNYAEFLAGTSANNPASKLDLVAATLDSTTGAYSIEWTSVPGKTYRIEGSPDLVTWGNLGTAPASGGATTTLTGTLAGPVPGRLFVKVSTP